MADRIALAIEPDTDTADQIRRLLEPKGFRVESIPNGDDAMEWGRTNKPAVIILSVEPRKVGYAISNKLRRSPSLREVPLMLISSEETLATFEQHKKLKSRADEYLLKPLEESVFVAKVDRLAGWAGGGDDEVHELDADSDIVLAEDDEDDRRSTDDDDEERTLLMADGVGRGRHRAAKTPHDTGRDAVRGREVRSGDPGGVRRAGGGRRRERRRQSDDMVDLRNLWSDDDLPPNLGWEAEGARPGKPVAVAAADDDPDAYRTGETLGPEAIGSAAPLPARPGAESTSAARARGARVRRCGDRRRRPRWCCGEGFVRRDGRVKEAEARNSELEARIHSLENERQTLRKEIEEARERFTQSATFSKEREFLGLREIINKKEKDILDLRDALDAKERQILDHKDKIRELDRARRDLEEASLGLRAQPGRRQRAGRRAGAGQREVGASARRRSRRASTTRTRSCARRARRSTGSRSGWRRRTRAGAGRERAPARRRGGAAGRGRRRPTAPRSAKLNDEHGQAMASAEGARQAELARIDGAHRAEVDGAAAPHRRGAGGGQRAARRPSWARSARSTRRRSRPRARSRPSSSRRSARPTRR